MPPRHRFLEPIHNVKDGSVSSRPRPKPRRSGLHPWKISRSLRPLRSLGASADSLRRRAHRLASRSRETARAGGASRDRTDDLKLAKLALSQLSYGPSYARLAASIGGQARRRHSSRLACQPKLPGSVGWWAEKELNLRPHAYQACALTT